MTKSASTTVPESDSGHSTSPAETRACIDEFLSTLQRLNQISEAQNRAIGELAIHLAQTARAMRKDGSGGADVKEAAKKVASHAEELKSSLAANREASTSSGPGQEPNAAPDSFCDRVEDLIWVAMRNSLDNQQHNYTLAEAALTQGIEAVYGAI